jgi:hypothetical protein
MLRVAGGVLAVMIHDTLGLGYLEALYAAFTKCEILGQGIHASNKRQA